MTVVCPLPFGVYKPLILYIIIPAGKKALNRGDINEARVQYYKWKKPGMAAHIATIACIIAIGIAVIIIIFAVL